MKHGIDDVAAVIYLLKVVRTTSRRRTLFTKLHYLQCLSEGVCGPPP